MELFVLYFADTIKIGSLNWRKFLRVKSVWEIENKLLLLIRLSYRYYTQLFFIFPDRLFIRTIFWRRFSSHPYLTIRFLWCCTTYSSGISWPPSTATLWTTVTDNGTTRTSIIITYSFTAGISAGCQGTLCGNIRGRLMSNIKTKRTIVDNMEGIYIIDIIINRKIWDTKKNIIKYSVKEKKKNKKLCSNKFVRFF